MAEVQNPHLAKPDAGFLLAGDVIATERIPGRRIFTARTRYAGQYPDAEQNNRSDHHV